MREILFRGKREDNGEWVYGNLIYRRIWKTDICVIRVFDSGFDIYEEYDVIPETVGQYTGLTDKNGTKVFEGDVLKGAWKTILTIFYDEITLSYRVKTSAGYDREPSYYGIEKLEVIGNIYDNPELMRGEE